MTSDGAASCTARPAWWVWPIAFLAYLAAAALGLVLAFPGTNASPFWPPTALAFALLYRYGLRLWPVILAGAFTINLLFILRAGIALEPAMIASIGVGVGNMLEALIGIHLVRALADDRFPLESVLGLFAFLFAAAVAPLVSATVGVTASRWASLSGVATYGQNWLTWWIGDVSGALTMAPILMLLLRARWRFPERSRWIEVSALLLTQVLGSVVAFGLWQHHGEHRYPLMFVLLPLILWSVLRFRIAGAASAVFLISSIAVVSALAGGGPFALPNVDDSLILLQVFIIVLAGTTLSLGAVLTERGRLATSLAQSNAELNDLAFNDPLTGLPNRRSLVERIEQATRSAHRHQTHSAILFLDLDRFKRINDSLGHVMGDEVLKAVARRIQATLRDEDSVCRLGGDEFVVLLWNIEAATDAAVVARKLIDILQAPLRLANLELDTSASIGIVLIPEDGTEANNLIRYADLAMYRAKQRRGSFQFYKDEMNRTAIVRLEREHELRCALLDGQFDLYYQPIVDMRTLQPVGIEALLRWKHPQRGLLLPSEFIPLAEETGLIIDIGAWALQRACAESKQLHEAGQRSLRLSVNMSLHQLHDPKLPRLIAHVLEQTRFDALWLNIEITERLLREELLAELDFLHALDRIGIALTVDNFGSAGSSLNLLTRLPVAIIKIDHKLVAHLLDDQAARDITLAMIAMAHQLGLAVVAENVETQAQVDFLAVNSCDYAQGFWFHRPLPMAALAALLTPPRSVSSVG